MNDIPSLLEKAVRIAVEAHEGQKRKDGPPYIIHPIGVALKLAKHGFPDEVIAAGLLHDVLEDTDYPPEKLRSEVGETVWGMVTTLTQDDTLSWKEKKLAYLEKVRTGPVGARAVSLADAVHNMESLVTAYAEHGDVLWKVFNTDKDNKIWYEEKKLALLREGWDHPMLKEYEELIEWMKSV